MGGEPCRATDWGSVSSTERPSAVETDLEVLRKRRQRFDMSNAAPGNKSYCSRNVLLMVNRRYKEEGKRSKENTTRTERRQETRKRTAFALNLKP
jgi:hypothetical protein